MMGAKWQVHYLNKITIHYLVPKFKTVKQDIKLSTKEHTRALHHKLSTQKLHSTNYQANASAELHKITPRITDKNYAGHHSARPALLNT